MHKELVFRRVTTPSSHGQSFTPVLDSRPRDAPWPAMSWPIARNLELHGESVLLRRLDPGADAGPLFAALDRPEVWKHVPGRPRDAGELMEALRARSADPRWHQWLVVAVIPLAAAGAGEVIGTTSYLDASPADARLEIGATAYAPSVWGTVVNPEVKLLLLAHAFDHLAAGRVQLKTDVRNTRAQRAIAALGARYEGTLRRYQRRADGSVRDTALFSITAEDWPEVRTRLTRRVRTR